MVLCYFDMEKGKLLKLIVGFGFKGKLLPDHVKRRRGDVLYSLVSFVTS